MCSGDSANAVPPTKKLRTRVTRIWGDRRGQPNRSAMERPRSGPTSFGIEVQPVPGKYAYNRLDQQFESRAISHDGLTLIKIFAQNIIFNNAITTPISQLSH